MQFAEEELLPRAAQLPAGPRDAAVVALLLQGLEQLPEALRARLSEVGLLTDQPAWQR